MKRTAWTLVLTIILAIAYIVFAHNHVCVNAASSRSHELSDLGLCPPILAIDIDELRARFDEEVNVGDSPELIKSALQNIGVSYSWDGITGRYQGVIRHPESQFHAISVLVYTDEKGNYKHIEVRDSFTSL